MANPFDREPTGPLSAARAVLPPGTLAAGALLADRFRVVGLLGHGGMGEVYEAEDLELGEHVALKTLRAGHASEDEALEGFRREIQLARKVTHVNVCRTYDLFRHRAKGEDGGSEDLTLVSMELLRGETLLERIRREGRLAPAAALPIVTQIAAGLAAAHRAGVVHRDLKSANVLLVPEPDGRVRAVVTDFGLAHEPAGERRAGGDPDWIVGTPTYMAPEQVEGKETTSATDLYALGIVMYEMVTGHVPFTAATPMASAMKRLSADPVPPRAHVPDLDLRWDAAIRRCLERDPADRFASADDLLRALLGARVAPSRRQRQRRIRVAASILAVLVAVAGALFLLRRPAPSVAVPEAPLTMRRSVAVLALAGKPRDGALGAAITEMIETELRAAGALRTIPGETVARLAHERGLGRAGADALPKIKDALGADLLVLGSREAKDGKLLLDLRVEEAKSGRTVAAVSESGPERDLVEIVARAGEALRRGLGFPPLDPRQAAALRAARAANAEAARLYAEGLALRRVFDARAAKDLLTKAIAADPSYSAAHAALADAWAALGYDERAREEARRAKDLAGNLPMEDRLRIEARFHEAAREWPEAVLVAWRLRDAFPDDAEYGVQLAEAQVSAARAQDALQTVAALRKLPQPQGQDPRIAMAESRAALAEGDFKRAAEAAAEAAESAARAGSLLLVARARLREGSALRPAGDLVRAVAANDEARRLFSELGDTSGVGQAFRQTADIRRYEGKLEEARKLAEEALTLARSVGDQRYTAWALSRIASVLLEEGRLSEALKRYEEARALAPETGDRESEATALNNIGVTLWQLGDLAAARRHIEGCLMFFRQLGQKRGLAFGSFNLGFVLLDEGDLAGAQKALLESLSLSRQAAQPSLEAMALHGLGNVALVRADFAEARKRHEEALGIRRSLGEKGRSAESLLALATVAFEEGRNDDVLGPAQEALAIEDAPAPHTWALTHALIAEWRLASGDKEGAFREAALARTQSAKTEHYQARAASALAAARVAAASDRGAEALLSLERLLAEADDRGHAAFALRIRLAVAALRKPSAARAAELAALEKDAASRGFLLVARRARALGE